MEENLRTVLIRLNDPTHVDDLCAHFRRAGLLADRVGAHELEVTRPESASPEQERNEVAIHLRVYEVGNPGVVAEVE